MEGDHIIIWQWLKPLSWLYGLVITLRNILFDCGILRSESFDVPVISVGNLTAGGTGKTPHTEYLIRLFGRQFQVAVLSRGYKRKSHGFKLAEANTPMRDIGDEPYQMKEKYPFVRVAVDKKRTRGIKHLCSSELKPETDVVILDDAFQHRYVIPGVNILLMDYHRLIYYDQLLPAGRLREPRSSSQRADIVIVTKCPTYITPMEKRGIARSLEMQPWQKLYFTTFRYGNLQPVHMPGQETEQDEMELSQLREAKVNILLLTGIASPQQMEYDLKKYCEFTAIHYADHHNFTKKDLAKVEAMARQLSQNGKPTIIVTTEKDAARLSTSRHHIDSATFHIYKLPIEVQFLDGQDEDFNQTILGYVKKNSRNSILLKGKNKHTT